MDEEGNSKFSSTLTLLIYILSINYLLLAHFVFFLFMFVNYEALAFRSLSMDCLNFALHSLGMLYYIVYLCPYLTSLSFMSY